jgi:hypothetical protein
VDSSTEEFFRTFPPDYLFGDIETFVKLCALVTQISGKQASIETGMRLMRQLAMNFDALKRRIRGKLGRAELRKRLQAVADGARQIREELEDSAVLSALVSEERAGKGNCSAHDVRARLLALEDLFRIAEAAAEKVPEGKGPTRHHGDGFSAQEMCAYIVRDLWRDALGDYPGSQNLKVWQACERLWEAAGGEVSPKGGEEPSRWRRHLEKAEMPRRPTCPGDVVVMMGGDGQIGVAEILASRPGGSTN